MKPALVSLKVTVRWAAEADVIAGCPRPLLG